MLTYPQIVRLTDARNRKAARFMIAEIDGLFAHVAHLIRPSIPYWMSRQEKPLPLPE